MKVLVALDCEPFASVITNYICNNSWAPRTQFQLINVTQPVRSTTASYDLHIQEADFKSRVQMLQEYGRRIQTALPNTHNSCTVATGDTIDELLSACKHWKPDLLILGSHSAGMLERKLLGSVSHALLNQADCAILVVKLPAHLISEFKNSKIKNHAKHMSSTNPGQLLSR